MFELIHKLFESLNNLKRFEAGYTSENQNEMLVKFDNKVYKLSLVELGEGETSDYIKELK